MEASTPKKLILAALQQTWQFQINRSVEKLLLNDPRTPRTRAGSPGQVQNVRELLQDIQEQLQDRFKKLICLLLKWGWGGGGLKGPP